MKLKYFYLGLLSVVTIMQTEGVQQRLLDAPKVDQKLKEHEAVAAKIAPKLDLGVHGKIEDATKDIHKKLGASSFPTGDTTNHRITDLHATLGVHPAGGLPGNHAHKRVEDVAGRLGAAAALSGSSVHEKVTDLLTIQGAVSNAAAHPKNPVVGLNAADLAGSAIKNEEAILARLKAGIAALHLDGGEYRVRTIVQTKTTGTAAGAAPVAADIAAVAAAGCNNIEDLLAELGW